MKNKVNWFIVFLIGFFLTEAIYKLLFLEGFRELRIAGVVKFMAQLYMAFIILKDFRANKFNLFLLAGLFITYLIGQLALPNNENIIANFEYLNNALFIIILLLFFNTLKLTDNQKRHALKYFEILIIINSIAIIIGLLFSISYFRTYWYRFGYDGFISKQSYASYFYLIALFYFIHKTLVLKKGRYWSLALVVMAACLTGTKATLLALVMCFIYVLIKKKLIFNKIVLGLLGVFITGLLVFKEDLIDFVLNKSNTFGPIIDEYGITTALFSYRDLILQEQLLPYVSENWNIINYLFGGMGDIMIMSGLDLLDLVYFFGIIGASIYGYVFYKVLYTFKPSFDFNYFIVTLLIIAALGGNFFYNSSLAIFLCGLRIYFELQEESKVDLLNDGT